MFVVSIKGSAYSNYSPSKSSTSIDTTLEMDERGNGRRVFVTHGRKSRVCLTITRPEQPRRVNRRLPFVLFPSVMVMLTFKVSVFFSTNKGN